MTCFLVPRLKEPSMFRLCISAIVLLIAGTQAQAQRPSPPIVKIEDTISGMTRYVLPYDTITGNASISSVPNSNYGVPYSECTIDVLAKNKSGQWLSIRQKNSDVFLDASYTFSAVFTCPRPGDDFPQLTLAKFVVSCVYWDSQGVPHVVEAEAATFNIMN